MKVVYTTRIKNQPKGLGPNTIMFFIKKGGKDGKKGSIGGFRQGNPKASKKTYESKAFSRKAGMAYYLKKGSGGYYVVIGRTMAEMRAKSKATRRKKAAFATKHKRKKSRR